MLLLLWPNLPIEGVKSVDTTVIRVKNSETITMSQGELNFIREIS